MGSAEPFNYTEIPRRKSTTMNVGKKNTIVNPDDNYGLQKLLERNQVKSFHKAALFSATR